MKSFTEYIMEKEEIEIQQQLDEDFAAVAGTVLGYSSVGLLVGWGSMMLVKGYISLASKAIRGIKKAWKGIFNKNKQPSEVVNDMKEMKASPSVRIALDKSKEERGKYEEKLGSVFSAIQEKDADKATSALKESGVPQTPIVNRVIIGEITQVLGEPPIHYGNTGNDAYLFVKKILGIKVAQAAATVVKEAMKKQGSELIKDIDKE